MEYNQIMNKKKLRLRVLFLVIFILFFNYFAMRFHWYYSLWWLDMFMHFLGGFWLALATMLYIPFTGRVFGFVMRVILFVLIIAGLWEVFEFILNNETTRLVFDLRDVLSDFAFNLAGAFTSFIYFFWRIMPPKEDAL